jgi:hypothetical protein
MEFTYINKKGETVNAIGANNKFKTNAIKYYKKTKSAPNGYFFNEKGHLKKITDADALKSIDIRQLSKQDFKLGFEWMGFHTKQSLLKYIKRKNINTISGLLDAVGRDHDAKEKVSSSLRKVFYKKKFEDLFKHTTVLGSAYKGYNKHYSISDGKDYKSSEAFWKAYARRVRVILLHFGYPLDVRIYVNARLVNSSEGDTIDKTYFLGKKTILNGMDVEDTIQFFIDETTRTLENEDNHANDESKSKDEGSPYVLDSITGIKILLNKKKKVSGGSTMKIPKELVKKVINPNNTDDECIIHCINIFEHYDLVKSNDKKDVSRFKKYYYKYDALRKKLKFPVAINDIPKIESHLKLDIVVYDLDLSKNPNNMNILPLYAPVKKYDRVIYLVLVHDDTNSHYVWARDKDKLLAHMHKNQDRRKHCDRCFQFINPAVFDTHSCVENPSVIKFPKRREQLRFKTIWQQLFHQFVGYADTETLSIISKLSQSKNENLSKTQTISQHIPCSFMYIIVRNGATYKTRMYRGQNSIRVFLNWIQEDYLEIYDNFLNKKFEMTHIDWDDYNSTTRCKLCDVEFSDDNRKCRDHDHITGKYRQALCNHCNFHYRVKKYLVMFFHNLKGYDGHFILPELNKDDMKFEGIATNSETMSLFSLKGKNDQEICFRDSYSFLPTSLDELSQITPDDEFVLLQDYCNRKYSEEEYPDDDIRNNLRKKAFAFLRNKGPFCYDYMDGWERFDETSLPPIQYFASKIKYHNKSYPHGLTPKQQKDVQKQYDRAWQMWDFFECETLGDFHDIYLTSDVYILADVFENSRKHSHKNYGLDPAHFYSGAQLYYTSMIKEMKDVVNLLCEDDRELYELFERGINGGISMIPHRYSKANNKYLKDYDPKLPDIFLQYIDANSLYPHAMKEALPCDDFEFLDINGLTPQDIIDFVRNDDGDKGFLLRFKLGYLPHILQDYTVKLPFFPQKTRIDSSHLNSFQNHIQQILQNKDNIRHSSVKLCPNFWEKEEVICHSKNFNLFLDIARRLNCLDHIKIEFISVVRFTQKPIFRESIIKRQNLRKNATTDFEKQMHKNSMNMPFGKTFEDVKKRRDFKLSQNPDHNAKLANNPRTLSFKILNEDCVLYHTLKASILLNKPIFLGWAILELSKYHMYKTFYNIFIPKYGDKVKLCLMDTDSFILEIKTPDLYQDLRQLDNHHGFMDWSNYPLNHPVFEGLTDDEILKKVKTDNITGLFKDEAKGLVMYEYAGIRAKTYSFQLANEDMLSNKNMIGLNHLGKSTYNPDKLTVVKSKGCSNKSTHQEYVDMVLFFRNFVDSTPTKTDLMKSKDSLQFRSYDHRVFTQLINKTTLTNFDDKFSTCPDGIHNFPHGHYKVVEFNQGLRVWNNETHDYETL